MANILTIFEKELGYINISNQYIELAKRILQKEYDNHDLMQLGKTVGLSISYVDDYSGAAERPVRCCLSNLSGVC